MGLDNATIEALLKGELAKEARNPTGDGKALPKPTQMGPLRWFDETAPCTSRGCTSPTLIRIKGAAKCTNHALHALNEIILREMEFVQLDECTCKAGESSRGNIHTYDCALVKLTEADKQSLYIPESTEPELL